MILAAVHTTGINWLGISPILGVIITGMALIITFQERRENKREKIQKAREIQQERQNQEIKQEIASSVDHLSEVLLAKLETKEAVSRISERLARIEGSKGVTVP